MKKLITLNLLIYVLISPKLITAQERVPVQIDQSTVVYMDELNAYFYQASVLFINFKDTEAAVELKKSSDYANKLSRNIPDDLKIIIKNIVNELNLLTSDLINLKVDNIQRLKRTYARSHYTLATCYYSMSVDLFNKQDDLSAIIALETASNYLAYGVVWVGYEPGKQTRATRKSIHNINIAVSARNEINKEELDNVMKYIGKELNKLGNKLVENKKEYDSYELKIVNK